MVVVLEDVAAEESVIGAMLLSRNAIGEAASVLTPEAFYRESHGKIFSSILELWQADKPVDPVTVADHMSKKGTLDEVGGTGRLAEIMHGTTATSNIAHYAEIVKELSVVRSLQTAGFMIQRLAAERLGSADELQAQAEEYLSNVSNLTMGHSSMPQSEITESVVDEIREAYTDFKAGKPGRTGLRTQFFDIDQVLMGLWPGQLIIMAARPSMGKSTLALNISENVVDNEGHAFFVSLEMHRNELTIRQLARAARIDSRQLKTGMMDTEQAKRLPNAVKLIKGREGLHVHDHGEMNLPVLAAEARRLHRAGKLDLLVVDYIQLMTPPKAENRTNEVGLISRGLKKLAMSLQIPVIGISQLNRAIESRAEKRPMLSDLRDSGSLEQDADVVIFLHDDSNYDPDKQPDGTAEVIIAKNRNGPNETIKMTFNKSWSRFSSPGKKEGETVGSSE